MSDTPLFITTSWDDGHPLDQRVAELLVKNGLPGTFYVPLISERELIDNASLNSMSRHFEIGGHTVSHCDLRTRSLSESSREIVHCKSVLEQVTSKPCESFGFPFGRFRRAHIQQVRDAGFTLARTVELMSLDVPCLRTGVGIMPTTLQATPAGTFVFLRNSLKRLHPGNFVRYAVVRRSDWVAMLEATLEIAVQQGGVVHLWGHSWEVELHQQWKNLDRAFSLLAQFRHQAGYFSNGELWKRLTPSVVASRTPETDSRVHADASAGTS